MYYTRRYNFKTGEIITEGTFSDVEDSKKLCEKLCEIENQKTDSRSVFITEESEEHERTIDEAIENVILQIVLEEGISTVHLKEITALFKEYITK